MSENDLILSIQIEAPHASECAPDTAADEISISISIESALTNPQKRKPMSENDLILSIQIEAPHASECAPDTAADEISISISIESALTNNQSEDLENQTK